MQKNGFHYLNIITLTKDGMRLFRDQKMTDYEFIKELSALDRDTKVILRTDRSIHLPTFVSTLDIVKGLGFSHLDLHTD